MDVGEPSVIDTISILRGLKERYETHHGVKVAEFLGLVAAATLSNRYITNRFMPDKAIDLLDEACANVRVQLDSQPEAIDRLERRLLQLEVEATALAKEKDNASKQRLKKAEEEMAQIKEEIKPLKMRYEMEKGRIDEVRNLAQKLEELKKATRSWYVFGGFSGLLLCFSFRKLGINPRNFSPLERRYDLATAADIRYYAIPDVEDKVMQQLDAEKSQRMEAAAGAAGSLLLTEVVTEAQIAEIVARWTGIPMQRLTKTAIERLLALGDVLAKRVIGQREAVESVAEAILSIGWFGRGTTANRILFIFGADWCWKN